MGLPDNLRLMRVQEDWPFLRNDTGSTWHTFQEEQETVVFAEGTFNLAKKLKRKCIPPSSL